MVFRKWIDLVPRALAALWQRGALLRRFGSRRSHRRHFSPCLIPTICWVHSVESLETRVMLSAVSWTGAAGDGLWSTAGNWSGKATPGPRDDVTIDGGPVTVFGTVQVGSLVNGGTLVIQGQPGMGSALLSVLGDVTNEGTIQLVTTSTDSLNRAASLSAGGTLTNDSGGVIDAQQAVEGGIAGNVTNSGTIDVEQGGYLGIVGHLVQQGGIAVESGATATFDGTFDEDGGTASGSFFVENSKVSVLSATTGTTIQLTGIGDTLLTDNLAGVTLWVEGISSSGAALNIVNSVTNFGTILLETSEPGPFSIPESGLFIANGATLANAFSGIIDAEAGAGGFRPISGHLVQQGQIEVGTGATATFDGNLDEDGGTYSGLFLVENSNVSVLSAPVEGATIQLVGIADKLVTNNLAGVTLWVEGDASSSAALTVIGSVINDGTILLETSATGPFGPLGSGLIIATGATLTNTGGITAEAGAGGARTITGHLAQQGLVVVEAGTTLVFGGALDEEGGVYAGAFYVEGSKVSIFARPILATATIQLLGTNSLLTNNLAGVTLWVEGAASTNAVLTVSNSAANFGTILLETSTTGPFAAADSDLVVAKGAVLTNAAAGVIDAELGAGGFRGISGQLVQQGLVEVGAGASAVFNGTLYDDGGRFVGAFYVENSSLSLIAAPNAITFQLLGANSLLTDVLPNVTLWVSGGNSIGATLTIANTLTNYGKILLESTSSGFGGASPSTLSVSKGAVLTNAATGVIEAGLGAGGVRTVAGNLIQQGLVQADSGTSITISGALTSDSGQYTGQIDVQNADLSLIDVPNSPPVTLELVGQNNLLTDNPANYTLWVEGTDFLDALLTIPQGITNLGTILLESSARQASSVTVTGGTLLNASTGVIDAALGAGGTRNLTGSLVNAGTFRAETDATIDANGGAFANQGAIQMSGGATLTVDAAVFQQESGSWGGAGTIQLDTSLAVDGTGSIGTDPTTTVRITGNLQGTTTSGGQFSLLGTVAFAGAGTAKAPQFWEAMSLDEGNVADGFTDNFAYGTVRINGNTYVRLTDNSHNSAGAGPEAVYVDQLTIASGATLDLGGFHLYARSIQNQGTILNGTVSDILDTTPLTVIQATEGKTNANVILATFSDGNPAAVASDFQATVNWGGTLIGSPTAGVRLVSRSPTFSTWKVVGTATYAEQGNYGVSLSVKDADGQSFTAKKTSFSVADAPLSDTTLATTVSATEGLANVNVVLMTFTDGTPSATAGDFSISNLNWGGVLAGATPVVSVVDNPSYSGPGSGWKVVANLVAYAEKGTYTISLTVKDADGQSASTAKTGFNVADAPLTDTTARSTLSAVEGHATGNVVLATFTDGNPVAPLADFAAKVNWGGTVLGTPNVSVQLVSRSASASQWQVLGSAIYAEKGMYTVTVTVTDADGGSVQTSQTKVSVADAPLTDTTPARTVNATKGKATGYVVLATFNDGNPYATAAAFNISVNWGGAVSGTPKVSLILVSRTATGSNWEVVANVTFLADGLFTPVVTIADADGSNLKTQKTKFNVTG